MNGQEIVFVLLGVLTAAGGLAVVLSTNVVRGALSLVVALGGVGAIFLLLGAEFLGWVQFLIYVGAVVVLLLFGLMLTKAPIGRDALDNQQRGIAALVALATFGVFTWMIWDAFGSEEIVFSKPTTTAEVGTSIFTNFILPFEAVSVLLLASLIGAIVLARKD